MSRGDICGTGYWPLSISSGPFSNRPVLVKRFQTYPPLRCRYHSRARASLRNRHHGPSSMGFEDEVEQSFDRTCPRARTVQGTRRTHLIHRPARDIIPTAWWNPNVLLSPMIESFHAATTSRVQRNSLPSIQMRCMITASRRASATIAFLSPRCLAIFIAQALSQDHFVERTSMLWAAS